MTVTGQVLLLSLSYVVVAALLLHLNLTSPRRRAVKFLAIVMVSALYLGAWYGWRGMSGWASSEPVPDEFRVLWITIDEPDKATRKPGAIFYWLRALDRAGLPIGEPRAHRVAYSEAAAVAAEQALAAIDEGQLLNGRTSRNLLKKSDERVVGDLPDDVGGSEGEGADGPVNLTFLRVPPPDLPPKVAPVTHVPY